MALFLRESDVATLVTMPQIVEAVEAIAVAQSSGAAWLEPRQRLRMPRGMLHTMSAAWPGAGTFVHKSYAAIGGDVRFRVHLYDARTGVILAVIEGNRLGQMRTGAATAVAARRLLPAGQHDWAVFGTGLQAFGQVEALLCVAAPAAVRVFGRDAARRAAFAAELRGKLGVAAVAAETATDCVAGARVVVTATTSRDPVFNGEHLARGAFVAAVGANLRIKRELDGAALKRIDRIVVDDVPTAQRESGLLLTPTEAGFMQWSQIPDLPGLVAGRTPPRLHDDETLCFHSLGSATWDLAAAMAVYDQARARGIGSEIPLD